MHLTRLAVTGSALVAVLALTACDPASKSDNAAAAPTTPAATSAAASASPSPEMSSADPVDRAATAKACSELKQDIQDNANKIAKAKRIGPPVGNIAVSAQWAAGSTAVIAHSIGAAEPVSAAADKVQKEMMSLSDAYNKSAKAKPSEQKLDAAIKSLTTACAQA